MGTEAEKWEEDTGKFIHLFISFRPLTVLRGGRGGGIGYNGGFNDQSNGYGPPGGHGGFNEPPGGGGGYGPSGGGYGGGYKRSDAPGGYDDREHKRPRY